MSGRQLCEVFLGGRGRKNGLEVRTGGPPPFLAGSASQLAFGIEARTLCLLLLRTHSTGPPATLAPQHVGCAASACPDNEISSPGTNADESRRNRHARSTLELMMLVDIEAGEAARRSGESMGARADSLVGGGIKQLLHRSASCALPVLVQSEVSEAHSDQIHWRPPGFDF